MEFMNDINLLAVFVAAISFFALGAVWYSKMLFANHWIRYTKIDISDPNSTKGVGKIMLFSFIWMLISSFGIAVIRSRLEIAGPESGIKLGLLTGLFFGVSAISISYLYEKRPLGLYFINGGYTLLGNIIAGLIICIWD